MITMRRQLLGLGFVAASSLLALHAAQALTGPTAIQIDGGPLGALQLSGGVDGYGYYLGNTSNGQLDNGINLANGLVELQKTDGVVQFTVEVGSNGGTVTVGAPSFNGSGHLAQSSTNNFTTGPLYAGYVTIAPTGSPVTLSAGQLGSLEGYESGIDWNNAVQLTTDLFYVENSQARGVQLNYTQGPITASVQFGDGFDTGVFNFVQALATYTINSTNSASIFGAANLGRTGLNTFGYGGGTTGSYGANYVNSDMIGGYYSYTQGNLVVVPEVQYVVAKTDHKLFLDKTSSNLGAAVFGDYAFGTSPYSLGGWVEYENSNGQDFWFVAPGSQAVGAAVAPTWQYKDLFARLNGGALYLLHNKGYAAYRNNGTDKLEFMGTLEAGLLF
jgi:hypothetical protein